MIDAATIETAIAQDDAEQELTDDIMAYEHDPLGYVLYVFPWGEAGTPLENETGPDEWQREVLELIGRLSREASTQELAEAIQVAVRSGHGIGKTAFVAWVLHWFISTRINPQIVVTANTKNQLDTKTWRELAKWNNFAINGHWFRHTATRFFAVDHPETWFAAAIPWSEHNSEAFAGTHDKNVLLIFDEASAIPPKIWEVASGAMTTPGAMWLVFGNATLNTGDFFECFGKLRHRWHTFTIDSRTAKKANHKQLQRWVDDYGEDSDYVRVRVRGLPPRASSMQFVGLNLVDEAKVRVLSADSWNFAPVVMGVDVARYGDDRSVICVRQGLKVHKMQDFRDIDTMQLASHVAAWWDEWKADGVFIDAVGVGAGVVDRLRQLHRDPIEVVAGSKALNKKHFNKRAEMWDKMKSWLKAGGVIPDNKDLTNDLTEPQYWYTPSDALQLESKDDMKARGCASPDFGDALAHTFAETVEKKESHPAPNVNALSSLMGEAPVGQAWMG